MTSGVGSTPYTERSPSACSRLVLGDADVDRLSVAGEQRALADLLLLSRVDHLVTSVHSTFGSHPASPPRCARMHARSVQPSTLALGVAGA